MRKANLRRAAASSGFTLIEILVVLVILGLAAGLAFAELGEPHRRHAEREARRLASALEHAAASAQWRGETLGVSAEGRGYRFWRRATDDRWLAMSDDDVLAPRTLPTDVTVAPMSFAGAPVPADAILPFRASGRNEPYALLLVTPSWQIVLAADPLNRVQVAAAPAASR